MATKKKLKKKSIKSKKTASRKGKPSKKQAKKKTAAKKSATKIQIRAVATTKRSAKKAIRRKKVGAGITQAEKEGWNRTSPASSRDLPPTGSGGQSGDLQGLSDIESADSESVDELIEEGNAFEAGVVMGVEEADEGGESEVHTHEVPEDDVPAEYLDEE